MVVVVEFVVAVEAAVVGGAAELPPVDGGGAVGVDVLAVPPLPGVGVPPPDDVAPAPPTASFELAFSACLMYFCVSLLISAWISTPFKSKKTTCISLADNPKKIHDRRLK